MAVDSRQRVVQARDVNHGSNAQRLVRDGRQSTWTGDKDLPAALVDLVELLLGEAEAPVRDVLDLVALAEPLALVHLAKMANPQALEDTERRGLITVSSGAPGDVVHMAIPCSQKFASPGRGGGGWPGCAGD